MKELERRALMGDKQAQEECARQEIALPCPFCGGAAIVEYDTIEPFEYTVLCGDCGVINGTSEDKQVAISEWNTRPAPPVGRCKNCKHLGERVVHETGQKENFCNHEQYGLFAFDSTEAYCSYFEPKEEETK